MPPRKKQCKQQEVSFELVDSLSDDDDESQDFFLVPPSPEKLNKSQVPWLEKYAPQNASEICINPTKLQQVRQLLNNMLKGRLPKKLLVLTGPCGSSKSTTVKLLARELCGGDIFNDSIVEYQESENFSVFLQSCRYKNGSIVLLEDLPNVYHFETLQLFREALRHWINYDGQLPPLVLCLSEFEYETDDQRTGYNLENTMTAETLLGRDLLVSEQVEVIKFNPLAHRFLSKTVKKVLKLESLAIDESFLNDIYKTGDIRSVMFNLEMWSRSRSHLSMIRENSLNIFHALGKIIYSSKEFDGKSSNYNSIAKVIELYPEKNSDLLNLGLLENYHIFQDSKFPLQIGAAICDDLSNADICPFGELGLRSTRINLSRVTQKPMVSKLKMKFPRHFRAMKIRSKTHSQVESYRQYLAPSNSFQILNLIDGFYLPLIYNKTRGSRLRYNRLGGRLQEVYAGEEVVADDDWPLMDAYDQFQMDIDEARTKRKRKDNIDRSGIANGNVNVNVNDNYNYNYNYNDDDDDTLSDEIENSTQSDLDFDDDDIDYLISQGKL